MSMRILVTHKGEAGYLHTEVSADLRTHYALTLDERNADAYSDRRRAEKVATRIRSRFESVAVEDAAAPEK